MDKDLLSGNKAESRLCKGCGGTLVYYESSTLYADIIVLFSLANHVFSTANCRSALSLFIIAYNAWQAWQSVWTSGHSKSSRITGKDFTGQCRGGIFLLEGKLKAFEIMSILIQSCSITGISWQSLNWSAAICTTHWKPGELLFIASGTVVCHNGAFALGLAHQCYTVHESLHGHVSVTDGHGSQEWWCSISIATSLLILACSHVFILWAIMPDPKLYDICEKWKEVCYLWENGCGGIPALGKLS